MKNLILKLTFVISLIVANVVAIYAQSVDKIIVGNDRIERVITIANNNIFSVEMNLSGSDKSFIKSGKEFSFAINNIVYNGLSEWKVVDQKQSSERSGMQLTQITIEEVRAQPSFRATLNYAVYPGLPLVRKWIDFENIGDRDLKIENLNIEDLNTTLFSVHSVVYHNYGRMKHLMKYEGDWDDAIAVVHNIDDRRGIAMGNEVASVLKRSAYHTESDNIEIGLTHSDSKYPFRKWLKPNDSWSSPKSFVCLYDNEDDGFQVVNNDVNRFVTNNMGSRVTELKHKPTFVYNTWNPFRSFIDDELVRDVAKAAAECGIQEFVIDDGWQYNANRESSRKGYGQNYGDWLVDTNKFPNGLKSTFDYIKSLGMKPGLWVSLGSANRDSKVFQEHPEWFVQNAEGEYANLHNKANVDMLTASFGTGWKDYITDVILHLVNEYGLEYAKLDLAVATSAYYNDDAYTGSYSTHHPDYRDRAESFIVIYENLLQMFDVLHEKAPNLFIDCTFETAGKTQLMDYAIAQHAEGNWLSNFEGESPRSTLRVRQMAWWRSPALPASSLVIGNLVMDDPNFELTLKSLIGTLPIVLGDPRELSSRERKDIKVWADWMNLMQDKHDYMSYRKDLPGFGEPREGHWDGWQRLNFNSNDGGIFGVFRQGGFEQSRRVVLEDLKPKSQYVVKQAPSGRVVTTATGKSLMEQGFVVTMTEKYDGEIFEVCLK